MRTLCTFALFVFAHATLRSQTASPSSCSVRNANIVKLATTLKLTLGTAEAKQQAENALKVELASADYVSSCGVPKDGLANLSAEDFEKLAVGLIEAKQVDKQVGANGGTGGSTSLVSHGVAPSIIGFAAEAGGIEREVSGTVVTLRANPANLILAMLKKYGPGATPPSDVFLNSVARINLAATFDTARTAEAGSNSENPFRANYKQLKEFSARAAIWDGRDPFRLKNWRRFRALAAEPSALNATNAAGAFLPALMLDAANSAATSKAIADLLDAADDNVRQAVLTLFVASLRANVLRLASANPTLGAHIATFAKASKDLADKRNALVRQIAGQAVFNFEYALIRPPAVTATSTNPTPPRTGLNANPDLSAFRLVGTWRAGQSDVNLNAAITIFNSIRPGMAGQFRDFNTGGSVSFPLGELGSAGKVTGSLAGRYMRLHQRPLGIDALFDSKKINTPGDIRWIQGKITFPGPNKSIKIPFSFSYSNRTELIDEKDVRVNIGFSFDMDAILRTVF